MLIYFQINAVKNATELIKSINNLIFNVKITLQFTKKLLFNKKNKYFMLYTSFFITKIVPIA